MARVSEVETVQAMFSAFERERTIEAALAFFAPDVEWIDGVTTHSTLHGHQGFRDAMAQLQADGYEVDASPERYTDLGNGRVLAAGSMRLRQAETYTDLPAFWAFEIRGGKIVRGGSSTRRDDALAAVGK